MSKEGTKDNSCGVTAVILGILSILLAGLNGAILAIIALVFASKQKPTNLWARRGKILAIIGLVLSILAIIAFAYLAQNPELLAQFTQIQ